MEKIEENLYFFFSSMNINGTRGELYRAHSRFIIRIENQDRILSLTLLCCVTEKNQRYKLKESIMTFTTCKRHCKISKAFYGAMKKILDVFKLSCFPIYDVFKILAVLSSFKRLILNHF